LPLVQEEEGKLRLCQPGLDALRELKQPLALVSIAGTPRCGKSFLANQLLGRMDGFRVSSAPCTRGLWLWSHPLPGLPAEAEAASLTMLLLDCEGVASDTAVSDRLFCLTAALSSAMCFNVSGAIDEEHLLHLAALLADTAPAPLDERLHGESARTNRPHSDSHIPAFVWAVRDVSQPPRDARGRPLSPAQYLETALLTAPLHVRQQLCRQLPCRDSVILPRPVADERLLAQLHRLPPSTLRPKFNHAVTDLRNRLHAMVRAREWLPATPADGAVVVSALCACTTYLNGCRAEPVEGESEGEEASPAASVAGAIDACAQGVAEWLGMTVLARREWAMRQNGDASKPLKVSVETTLERRSEKTVPSMPRRGEETSPSMTRLGAGETVPSMVRQDKLTVPSIASRSKEKVQSTRRQSEEKTQFMTRPGGSTVQFTARRGEEAVEAQCDQISPPIPSERQGGETLHPLERQGGHPLPSERYGGESLKRDAAEEPSRGWTHHSLSASPCLPPPAQSSSHLPSLASPPLHHSSTPSIPVRSPSPPSSSSPFPTPQQSSSPLASYEALPSPAAAECLPAPPSLQSREAYMGEARRSPQPTPACEDTGCGEAETAPPTPRPASEDAAPRDRTTRRAEGNTAVEAVANCACCMDGWISACAGGRVGEASAGGAEESTAMLRRESSGGVLLLALRNDLLRLEDEAEAQRSVLHAIEERMDEERRKARREVAAHAAAREAAEAELRALKEARGNEARAHRGEAAEDVEASVARAVAQAVARKQMEIEAARETARLSLRLQIDAERQAKERDASEAQQRYDEVARQLASARRVVGEQEVLLNERAKIIDELRASKSTQDAEELSVLRASRDEAVTQMMALRRSVRFALVRAALSRRSGQACLAALSHWRRSIDSLGEVMTLRGRLRLAQLLLLRRLAASDEEATLRSALHTWSSTLPRVLASRQTTAPTLGVHHLVVLTLAARARSSAARLAHALRVWAGAVTSMERAACVQLLHLAGDAVAPLPLLVRTALAKARVDDFSGAAAAQRAERSAELMRAEAELLRREAVAEMQQARALVHSVMTPYLAEQRASSHRWAALMLQSFLMSNWAAACRGALLVWRSAARRAELRPPSVDQLRWASPEDVPSDVYSDSPLGAALRAAAFAAQAMGCPLEVTLLPSDDAT